MSSDKTAPPSIPPRQSAARGEGSASKGAAVADPVVRAESKDAGHDGTTTTVPERTPLLGKPAASAVPPAATGAFPAGPTASGARAPHAGGSTGAVPRTPTKVAAEAAPRRVRLAISRVDPWSVMKLSFLLSVAVGIMIVVGAAVVWLTLDGMHVFTKVDDLVREVVGAESKLDILQYVEFSRIVSASALIAVADVFLLTALSTIGAFLYNIVAALVGGVHVTMTDE